MPNGNPHIARHGALTRFGQRGGPNPSRLAKEKNPAQVRVALRRIAAFEFDITEPITMAKLTEVFSPDGRALTGAQMIAVRKFYRAMQGDIKMLQQVTDEIDGKQVEARAEARASLADLVLLSYEVGDGAASAPSSDQ